MQVDDIGNGRDLGARAPQRRAAQVEARPPPGGAVTSILVVDEGPADREVLATILRDAGHRVLTAATGEHGLALARIHRPDLIIADTLMPTMDGYELVRELRAAPVTAGIPVVFYTASYVIDEIQRLADACGVSHVIVKPAEAEEIIRTVSAVLTAPPRPPATLPSDEFHRAHLRTLNAKLLQEIEELRATLLLAAAPHQQADGEAGDVEATGTSHANSAPHDGASARNLLSPRELEVMAMIAQGATDAEIAQGLAIANTTVQSHVKHILRKLAVRNRTEAAVRFLSGERCNAASHDDH
jgi:DNA-binding NarL/FixJ family response regulator